MKQVTQITVLIVAVAGSAPSASGDLVYVAQERLIEVATTANETILTRTAPNFAPFVETLTSTTTFQTPNGPAQNTGESTIDCQLDPNAIRASGSLTGAGGLSVTGNLEAGEAAALIFVTFSLTSPTPYQILGTPRPSNDPRDEWEIELANFTTGTEIFRIDETAPAQSVNVSGVLAPGTYTIQFEVEMTVEAAQVTQAFDFQFLVPAPASAVVLGFAPIVLRRRR